jgi:iron complex outermembrane receptor protein
VEVTFVPVEGLTLDFAYAYTDASYGPYLDYTRRDPVTNAPTLSSGRIFPFTPRNKGNIAVRWKLPTPEAYGGITASLNWAYKSQITLGLVPFITVAGVNVPDGESIQKPTSTVDFNLDWRRIAGSRVDASLFVTNLTDVTYKIGGASLINSGLGVNQRIYNEPRMIGVQLRYSFGE